MKRKKLLLLILSTATIFFSFSSFASSKIEVLTIEDNIIGPVIEEYISSALERASSENTRAIIIRLNTPGGLLKSTQDIVQLILNSQIPVITYIWPKGARAASAGTFIGYASHILAMAPSTHLGAAHPIGGGSKEIKQKVMNDILAWAKNIARERNRPFKFLEEAIKNSKSITEEEAKRKKIIDLIVEDLDNLLKEINQKQIKIGKKIIRLNTEELKVEFVDLTSRQKFLNTLIDPNIAYLLLTLGILGLIFEVSHPGFGFPGIFGIICLILAFYSLSILPVNYAGISLIVTGIIFLVVEAFTPSFGLFTLGGILCFLLGSTLLFNRLNFLQISLKIVIPLVIALSIWSLFILTKLIQSSLRKSKTGKDALLGEEGRAYTHIQKKGKVFIHGEIWEAFSEEPIKKGEKVEVEAVRGLTLKVRKKGGD